MVSRSTSRTVPGELAVVEAIRQRASRGAASSPALRLGIGDDGAILRPKLGQEICVTTDFTLEDRHFRRAWHPPESVGHRCLARGLSDLAAMGAEPLAVFLSLAIPTHLPARWLERFLNGFLALARKYRVPLAGGDTAQSPSISGDREGLILADIVAAGQVPRGKALLRSGARPGDWLYVSGSLGGSAAELLAIERSPRNFAKITRAVAGHPHLYPEPRIAVGQRLRRLATAAIDLSDGLSTDLTHLCEESGVAAVIEEEALPLHGLARKSRHAIGFALHGGEDYELLFTTPPRAPVPPGIGGVPLRRIGVVRKWVRGSARVEMETTDGKKVAVQPRGWEHFRAGQSAVFRP